MSGTQHKLTRIGVFYDGNYFLHVSNYYAYHHERRNRLSIAGLHEFVRHRIADEEGKEFHLCQIVDAHYFRGRLSAQEASAEGNRLYYDRLFDDILMMEGVTTHYLPVRTVQGYRQERQGYRQRIWRAHVVVLRVGDPQDYISYWPKLGRGPVWLD